MSKRDRWLGGFWGVLAGLCLYEARAVWNGWDGTGVMLLAVGTMFLLLGAGFVLAPQTAREHTQRFTAPEVMHIGVTAAAFALYATMMEPLGYLLATWGFLFAVAAYLSRRRLVVAALWTAALAVATSLVFRKALNVSLPSGPFGW